MEGKITTYLFYTGILFALAAIISTTLLLQKNAENNMLDALQRECEAFVESAEDITEESFSERSEFAKAEIIEKDALGSRGESFNAKKTEKYKKLMEKQGYARGIIKKDGQADLCFFVMPVSDAYFCVYAKKPSISQTVNNAFPFFILILIGAIVASAIFSVALAGRFMKPVRKISDDDFVFSLSDDHSGIYEELIPILTVKSKAEKMKRQFTANVSHELKTPLTSILGYSQLIESEIATGNDVIKFASVISKESQRMLYLVGDILKLSELEEERGNIVKESIDLYEVSKSAVEALEMVAKKTGITLKLSGEPTVIKGNKSLIYELIYNLCDNAIRYNKPCGSVAVSTKNKAVTVSDTGIGIDKKYHSRIFERFYRVDKSRSKQTGGTGLGLSIVKHIAELHDGKITITSEPDRGTQIKVSF